MTAPTPALEQPQLIFKITDVGLAEAASAAQKGIKVELSTFGVADGANYIPNRSQTSFLGNLLYQDQITEYVEQPDGSLLCICTMNSQAGPFDFGEVGVFTSTGVLFAVAAFPQYQHKYTSLGTNVDSVFTFNCHLNLAQGTALFQVNSFCTPNLIYASRWHLVTPPPQVRDSTANQLVVTELDYKEDYTTLVATKINGVPGWSIQSNYSALIANISNYNAPASPYYYLEIPGSVWASKVPGSINTSVAYAQQFDFVIECGSYFRQATISRNGAFVRFTFTDWWDASIVGKTITIWTNDGTNLVGASVQMLSQVGQIEYWATPDIPPGRLLANGAVYTMAEYPTLGAALRNTWGGDGVTTFGVPNYMGMFIRGFDFSNTVDPGRQFGKVQQSALGIHTHVGTAGPTDTVHQHSVSGNTSGQSADHQHVERGVANQKTPDGRVTVAANYGDQGTTGSPLIFSTYGASNDHTHYFYGATSFAGSEHTHPIYIANTGDSETRPINAAALITIRY